MSLRIDAVGSPVRIIRLLDSFPLPNGWLWGRRMWTCFLCSTHQPRCSNQLLVKLQRLIFGLLACTDSLTRVMIGYQCFIWISSWLKEGICHPYWMAATAFLLMASSATHLVATHAVMMYCLLLLDAWHSKQSHSFSLRLIFSKFQRADRSTAALFSFLG